MAIKDRLEEDLKQAMRARDEVTRDTLRMILADMKNRRIDAGKDLGETEELAVLQKGLRSRQDSAQQFEAAGREELAAKERSEIAVIEKYLPKLLSEDETRTIIERLIAELEIESKKDMGRLMKGLMAQYKGQVDGRMVQELAAQLLA